MNTISKILAFLVGIGFTVSVWMIFFYAPVEAKMGFIQKIFYFHVPCAWLMFLSVIVCALFSLVFLMNKNEKIDVIAHSAGELSVMFGCIVLTTGPIWGHKAWNAWWVWDVRLTSTLILELIFVAYVLVREYAGTIGRLLSSGLAVFGAINVPLIYFSVDLWRGTHPPRLIAKGQMDAQMLQTFLICMLTFTAFWFLLMKNRVSSGNLLLQLEDLKLSLLQKRRKNR